MKQKYTNGLEIVYIGVDILRLNHKKGRILGTSSGGGLYLIEFYDYLKLHDGHSIKIKGKNGHCWWAYFDEILSKEDYLQYELDRSNSGNI